MVFLVLSIVFLQNFMDLLADVINPLNEYGGFVNHRLIRGRVCLCSGKRKCNINGSQGLESQTHLKWAMAGGTMEISIVTVLDIWETFIPWTCILGIIHAQDVHNHMIYDLCLAINLWVESSGLCELGVQKRPETRPKGAKEPAFLVRDDGLWYPKVDPHAFEEELSNICLYEIILTGCQDVHLQKSINEHKQTVISFLGGWKSIQVIH
jgi:hypothetical protein